MWPTNIINRIRLRWRIKSFNANLESNNRFLREIDEEINKRRDQRDTIDKGVAIAEAVGRYSPGNLKVLAGVQASFLTEMKESSYAEQRDWLKTFEKEAVIRTQMLKESHAAIEKLKGEE